MFSLYPRLVSMSAYGDTVYMDMLAYPLFPNR